jgi:hypothetical protein
VASFAATWRSRSTPWLYQLRVDRIVISSSLDTTRVRRNEVAVSTGKTIVNGFESERAVAQSVGLRRRFGPLLTFHQERVTLGVGLGPYDGPRVLEPRCLAL